MILVLVHKKKSVISADRGIEQIARLKQHSLEIARRKQPLLNFTNCLSNFSRLLFILATREREHEP